MADEEYGNGHAGYATVVQDAEDEDDDYLVNRHGRWVVWVQKRKTLIGGRQRGSTTTQAATIVSYSTHACDDEKTHSI